MRSSNVVLSFQRRTNIRSDRQTTLPLTRSIERLFNVWPLDKSRNVLEDRTKLLRRLLRVQTMSRTLDHRQMTRRVAAAARGFVFTRQECQMIVVPSSLFFSFVLLFSHRNIGRAKEKRNDEVNQERERSNRVSSSSTTSTTILGVNQKDLRRRRRLVIHSKVVSRSTIAYDDDDGAESRQKRFSPILLYSH